MREKLETDRRHIAGRIDDIKAELARIGKTRDVQRSGREKSKTPIVALMGYTNSGKSAIMNRLLELSEREDKTVSSQDMLFATLDTQHRKITLEQGSEFILIDTVGFVSKLPHSLVEAFKSTLEEVRYADLLVHVVDSSYENRDFYMGVTNEVIDQIGAGGKERIIAYNKMDIAKSVPLDVSGHDVVYLSAKTGEHVDELVAKIREKIFGGRVEMTLLIPYTERRYHVLSV